jgi:uncharacterized membrane protein
MENMQPSRQAYAPRGDMPTGMTPATRNDNRVSRVQRGRPAAAAVHTARRPDPVDQLARGLGWFSIALGLAELLAPRALTRSIGAGEHKALTQFCGVRELAAGIGLLTQPSPAPWLWSRVAGDAMDLSLLAAAMRDANRDEMARLTSATISVIAVTALDVYAARAASTREPRSAPGALRRDGTVRVEHTMIVNRPAEECYRMWRDFENLPRFMEHLESVERREDNRSHWVAKGPAGMSVEWDAEVTRDEPNALLAWRSIEGSEVQNSGAVRFTQAAGDRGTMIAVTMQYEPPAGALGMAVAKLFGEEPNLQVREDLRRFKRLLETGEIPTIEGQPHGTRPLWYKTIQGNDQ